LLHTWKSIRYGAGTLTPGSLQNEIAH
jgi:hypothetical protein